MPKTVRIVEKKGKGPKGHRVTVSKTVTTVPKKKKRSPQRSRTIKRALGKSKAKHELGLSVSTPHAKDYDYTLIQSGADTRPFDASFDIAELSIASEGQIVFSQTISAVSAAIMQQESNKDSAGNSTVAQTMVSGILNYMEYRFTRVQLRLFGRVPDNVSGEIGVMFVPVGVKVTQANFVDLFDARAADKTFPGCKRISLKDLNPSNHKGKWITIEAEYQKGGRPIGLAEVTRDGVVGKIVIGMLTNALSGTDTVYVANSANPGPSSSSGQTMSAVKVTGDLCLLNMHVEGHWIFTAPGQVPQEGAISALEIVVNENMDASRVSTGNGSGDTSYFGNPITGTTPPILAEAILNGVAQSKLRGGPDPPANDPNSIGLTYMEDGSGTIGNFFTATTVKSIANTVVDGVSEFFPPGVRQLVAWGGRTMIGVIDRLINTQDGMLAKEQSMTADNKINIDTGAWPGSPNIGLALTPSQTHFTPNRNGFAQIPFSPAITMLVNHLGAQPAGSVLNNIFLMVQRCVALGLYPCFATATAGALTSVTTKNFSNADAMEIFLRNLGGQSSIMPTILTPAAGAPDDYYAGIPLFFNSQREGSVQPGYVRSDNNLTLGSAYSSRMGPTLLMLKKHPADPGPVESKGLALAPAFLEIDLFARTLTPSEGWMTGSLNGLIATLISDGADVYAIAEAVASFLGHEVSIRDGRFICFNHKFTYAARASLNGSGQWDPSYPIPLPANDSGYCTMITEIDSDAPVTVMYLGSTMVEHLASVRTPDDTLVSRNITHDGSQWEDGEGVLYFIEPNMCVSV